ncbi:hypothetical protein [Roseibacillus ishigakijimensis]|uniref:Uncharacterized protein n=1 Tax=Roseibacillus ishigakijimensis TaxID=454146 RepID=A0A934RPC0_9BACT|nr:hypothetical protein [Roseibacillus ishigakijimensis]MBK1834505.1 hypothetical protein [Roseibacillus ishigakijimensis]
MQQQSRHRLASDWFGAALSPPLTLVLRISEEGFHFSASREAGARCHPEAREGRFVPELWRHDVVELFLAPAGTRRYLEVNLSPNGAWWAQWFRGVREPAEKEGDFSGIQAEGSPTAEAWQASLFLPHQIFGDQPPTHFNLTAILDSPQQRFFTVAPLPGREPDFHQPGHFLPLQPA